MSPYYWGLLLFLSFVWGGSFFFVELALETIQPMTLVFFRVSLAALILTVFLYSRGYSLPNTAKDWYFLAVMGLLNNALPFSLISWGQVYISGSIASILNATMPIFTLIISHLFTQDEQLNHRKVIGIGLGFTGVVVMMAPTLEEGFSWQSYGQLAVLCGALCYAIAGVWGKRLLHNRPISNAAGMLICASLWMLPLMLRNQITNPDSPSLVSIAAILGIAIISTAAAYGIYFKILNHAGATQLSLVTLLVPVSAMALGSIFLSESLQGQALLGVLIIFTGLLAIDPSLFKWLIKRIYRS